MPLVHLLPANVTVEVPAGTRLTEAIRRAGQPIATPCGDDLICARCGVRVLRGRVARESAIEREIKRRNRVDQSFRLACAVRVRHDLTVTAAYWGAMAHCDRALILIDHGSRRPEAHRHLEGLAEQVRSRLMRSRESELQSESRAQWTVHLAHLEVVGPTLEDAIAHCQAEGARSVDILPLFLTAGRHLSHDLPEQVRRARQRFPELELCLLEPAGTRPELVDLILACLPESN